MRQRVDLMGNFGIQFDGENTYEEVVETLNERIVEIINSWDITKSLEQFLLSGNISGRNNRKGSFW